MAVRELGGISEVEGQAEPTERALPIRVFRGVSAFARKKPLGFVCGIAIIFFLIIGDAVPETINKASSVIGTGDEPVPYLADVLADNVPFLYGYEKQILRDRLEGSSGDHLLGTDNIGRDTLSRLIYGARPAVMVSLGGVFLASSLGAMIGIVSGFYGGWVDKGLYRLVDVVQALPGLVVFIVILGLWQSGIWELALVFGLVGGPIQSRVIRGQAIYVMSSPFIEAARVVGCGNLRIMVRYLLPNVFALVILNATFALGLYVILEATLSFLGYGLDPPYPSWGQMLSLDGQQFMRAHPRLAIYPGLAIALLVFSFNLFGDALRDVLDPRLRGSR